MSHFDVFPYQAPQTRAGKTAQNLKLIFSLWTRAGALLLGAIVLIGMKYEL